MSYLERLKQLETPQSPTDKTDRSTFVSSVSTLLARIGRKPVESGAWNERAAEKDDMTGKATDDPPPDPAAETRRQRVLTVLAEQPGIPYAVVVDNPDTDPVIMVLGIRGQATCELLVPREKFDPFLLLDLIGRHCGTIH